MVEIDNHSEGLSYEAQLAVIKEAYPLVWLRLKALEEQIQGKADLPQFDDDDEVIEPRNEVR